MANLMCKRNAIRKCSQNHTRRTVYASRPWLIIKTVYEITFQTIRTLGD